MVYKLLFSIVIVIFLVIIMVLVFVFFIMLKDMICKEFFDFNFKSMILVVFWILNEDIQYKKGDNVDFQEVDIVYIFKVIDICKKLFDKKIIDMKVDIMVVVKK